MKKRMLFVVAIMAIFGGSVLGMNRGRRNSYPLCLGKFAMNMVRRGYLPRVDAQQVLSTVERDKQRQVVRECLDNIQKKVAQRKKINKSRNRQK